jgi:hypothetical protein
LMRHSELKNLSDLLIKDLEKKNKSLDYEAGFITALHKLLAIVRLEVSSQDEIQHHEPWQASD